MAEETTQTTGTTTPTTTTQPEQPKDNNGGQNYDAFFEKLDSILDKRSEGLAKSALKDNGVDSAEIGEIVNAWKQSRTQKVQETTGALTTAQQENANLKAQIAQMQIDSVARDQAAQMGIDAGNLPYVTKLADLSDVLNDKGEADAEKINSALKKVLDDVPAFRTTPTEKNGFVKVGGDGGSDSETETEAEARLRRAFGLGTKK